MKRLLLAITAALTLLLLPGAATAQTFNMYSTQGRPGYYNPVMNQPLVSPYISLGLNGVNNPGLNYFLFTQPELQRRNVQSIYGSAINQLQREVSGEVAAEEVSDLRESGHPAYFGNTAGYFPSNPNRPASGPGLRNVQQRPSTGPSGSSTK